MKKSLNIIKKVFVGIVVIMALTMMVFTLISVSTFNRADRSLFGYKAFIVQSDSMSATDFDAGDLILVKEIDPNLLKVGDIISFQSSQDENYGEIVTHKIRKIVKDDKGMRGFVTYGTTTNNDDKGIVNYNSVVGKYEYTIPGVGRLFNFLKTTPGYIICIFLPFMIIILMQGIDSVRLFKKYKQEKTEEKQKKEILDIEKERKKLEEERLQSQQMIDELKQLKQELGDLSESEQDLKQK